MKRDVRDVDVQMVQNFLAIMKPVYFWWKDPEQHLGDVGQQAGFVAQDVEQQFPDWVTYDTDQNGNVRASLQLPHEMLGYMVAALKNLRDKDAEQAERMNV